MGQVMVYRNTLTNTAGYLARTKFICGHLHERLYTLSDKISDSDDRKATSSDLDEMFDMSNILDMMDESLEGQEDFMYGLAYGPTAVVAPRTDTERIAEGVNLDEFQDISTADMVKAFDAQCSALAAARREASIIALVVNGRGDLPYRLCA